MNYQFAKKIVASENVQNVGALLQKKTLQIGLGEQNCAVFKGKSYVIRFRSRTFGWSTNLDIFCKRQSAYSFALWRICF